MSLRRLTVLLAIVFFGAFACTDTPNTGEVNQNDSTANNDGQNDNSSDPSENQNDGEIDDNYYLEALGSTSHSSEAGNTVSLGVKITHGEYGPVSDHAIQYQVVESTGDSAVGFNASTVMSNDNGEATNGVRTGSMTGQIVVHATHAQVDDPVEFVVDVSAASPGDMRVSVDYPDEDAENQPLSDIEIRYWETALLSCSHTSAYSIPVQPYLQEDILPTVDDEVLYEDLDASKTYTVTATGIGPHDQISGYGCIDDIPIEGDSVTDAVVPLHLLPLVPMGTYDVTSYWDFEEALESTGPVGETIVSAFDWIADPGDAAAGYLVDLAVDWVCDEDNYGPGSWQCAAAVYAQNEGTAQETVADFINDQIDSIDILSDFQNMAEDIMNTVQNMKVDSLLIINDRNVGEGELTGLDIWQVVYFYWTANCGPNDPPDCGEIALDLGSGTNYGVLTGDWTGRLYDYDQLEIDPHEMVVPYGAFINQILSDYIYPSFTNGQATSLGEAFEYLLCDNLGELDIWGFTIPESTVQGFCSTAFSTVSDLVEFYIDTLQYDINLDISGHGHMIDLESDGRVDVIEDGYFYGELGDGSDAAEMDADFTAVRQQ